MEFQLGSLACALCLFSIMSGCRTVDPAAEALARMDRMPAAQRPTNWDQTKQLMARKAPVIGQVAPDFALRTLDGNAIISRSAHQAGRPLVLIFGSFT